MSLLTRYIMSKLSKLKKYLKFKPSLSVTPLSED